VKGLQGGFSKKMNPPSGPSLFRGSNCPLKKTGPAEGPTPSASERKHIKEVAKSVEGNKREGGSDICFRTLKKKTPL